MADKMADTMADKNSVSANEIKYRFGVLKRLKEKDKTPLIILLLSAIIGSLAGLVGVLFEIGTTWISNQRTDAVSAYFSDKWLMIPAMFVISAILAMIGYYLVNRFAPGQEALVFLRSKVHYKIYAQCAGGEYCRSNFLAA